MVTRNNNISVMFVRNTIDHPSVDVGTLCSSHKINKYSRYRPGYWTLLNQVLTFNLPAGGSALDPRGTDPNTGLNTQVYKLGDFRFYNHNAYAPYVSGDPEEIVYIQNNYSLPAVSRTVNFNLGEVDWWGDEWQTSYFHGRNNLSTGWGYVWAFDPETMVTYGKSHRSNLETSGYNSRMIFDVTINTPGQGHTTTINIQFGLGTDAKVQAKFPDVYKTLHFYRSNMPQWTIAVPSAGGTAFDNLTSRLIGLDMEDLTGTSKAMYCDFSPNSGSAPIGANSLNISQAGAVVTMYPTFNRYQVMQARWQVTARIVCYDDNDINNVVWQNTQTVVMALSGDGYTYSFPIPQLVQDGYNYMIYLEDFGNTNVSKIS